MRSTKTSFGTLLRRYRLAAGFTQEALAAQAGISARTIADLERGINRIPRHDTFELLASALELTTQQRALFLGLVRPEMTATTTHTLSSSRFPLPPTSLIGRQQEMAHALSLLSDNKIRLLTITGPAGIGKTRLALQLAQDLDEHFTDGVVFVPLASLHNTAQLPGEIAQFLGILEAPDGDITKEVIMFLKEKHVLLILDNFEQIAEAALYVAELLSTCPHISVLVTSRIPLHVRAEQTLPIAPLPLADAVALFQERARAIRPGGVYSSPEVAAICERLDRLPLAIELAAIHVKTLSLSDLYDRLSNRLKFLRNGARDLPARQQTMEEAMAWSYELLTREQQQCFRALGVFVGGWTLGAANAIYRTGEEKDSEEMILILAALVDNSLVQVDITVDGFARFGMFELIREYALQRLHAAGEEEYYKRQHALYFAQLSESASSQIPTQRAQAASLLLDIPNMRAAIQWAEEKHEIALGLQLVRSSWGGWFSQVHISEAEEMLERMLEISWQSGDQDIPFGLRAIALYAYGQSLLRRGKAQRAEAVAHESLERAHSIGDHCSMSSALAITGQIAQMDGNLDEAETFLVESDEHARLGGFPDLRGITLRNLAELARMQGDLDHAIRLYEEALDAVRALGMTFGVALIMTLLGHLARQVRNYSQAKERYRESLMILSAYDSPTYTAWCLEGYAAALCAEENYIQTARLCAAASSLREQVHTPLPSSERQAFEQTIANSQTALGTLAFEKEWATGAEFTQDQVIEYALSDACA